MFCLDPDAVLIQVHSSWSWYLMRSHLHLEHLCHTCSTPQLCSITHVLDHTNIILSHSSLPHAVVLPHLVIYLLHLKEPNANPSDLLCTSPGTSTVIISLASNSLSHNFNVLGYQQAVERVSNKVRTENNNTDTCNWAIHLLRSSWFYWSNYSGCNKYHHSDGNCQTSLDPDWWTWLLYSFSRGNSSSLIVLP